MNFHTMCTSWMWNVTWVTRKLVQVVSHDLRVGRCARPTPIVHADIVRHVGPSLLRSLSTFYRCLIVKRWLASMWPTHANTLHPYLRKSSTLRGGQKNGTPTPSVILTRSHVRCIRASTICPQNLYCLPSQCKHYRFETCMVAYIRIKGIRVKNNW